MPRSKLFDELCRRGIHLKNCIDVHLSVDALSGLSIYYQAYVRCSRDAHRTMQGLKSVPG